MASAFKDYYKTLNLDRNGFDLDLCKKNFRSLAKETHPDANKDKDEVTKKELEERFKEINEAYQALSDTEKRTRYDHIYDQAQEDTLREQIKQEATKAKTGTATEAESGQTSKKETVQQPSKETEDDFSRFRKEAGFEDLDKDITRVIKNVDEVMAEITKLEFGDFEGKAENHKREWQQENRAYWDKIRADREGAARKKEEGRVAADQEIIERVGRREVTLPKDDVQLVGAIARLVAKDRDKGLTQITVNNETGEPAWEVKVTGIGVRISKPGEESPETKRFREAFGAKQETVPPRESTLYLGTLLDLGRAIGNPSQAYWWKRIGNESALKGIEQCLKQEKDMGRDFGSIETLAVGKIRDHIDETRLNETRQPVEGKPPVV